MLIAPPPRPLTRTSGILDLFQVETESAHLPDEAAGGTTVTVEGWVADAAGCATRAAWLDVGGTAIPLHLDRHRADAAHIIGAVDRHGPGLGFRERVTLPSDVAPGMCDARIIAITASGRGVYAAESRRVRIAHPPRAARPVVEGASAAFDLRVRDTQTAPFTLGRGAHTIREEACLRVTGSVDGAPALQITATPMGSGEATTWHVDCDRHGHVDASLWTGPMRRGLYDLVVSRIVDDESDVAVAECFLELAGPHYLPPLHLPSLRTYPAGGITLFADAGLRAVGAGRTALFAGRPIAVRGTCIDPANDEPALAVYAAVDDRRPIPLTHRAPDRGFGGIIDTTRLEPGAHRVRLLGLAYSGVGWYVIDERTIELMPPQSMQANGHDMVVDRHAVVTAQ